ncbi:MAG: hypothetical protein IJ113_07315 [Eggerthellaceae bacterium]|nr:hypothetical protein [Eggerthellaceae bacterium]
MNDYVQPDLFDLSKGEADMQAAHEWRVRNYAIYCAMLRRAQSQMRQQNRVAIDELFNWARYSLDWEHNPSDYKLNNNLRAPLARLMIKDYPPLADYMETRDARCDVAVAVRGK